LNRQKRLEFIKESGVINDRLLFSHLMTALDYDGYANFIGIADQAAENRTQSIRRN